MLIQLQLETCYQFHSHLIKHFAEVSCILALESRRYYCCYATP